MRISKTSAQQIVEEIGKLVKQNINLMDESGYIIASNDHTRIGHFHEGAYRIIQNHLSEFYITPELERSLPRVRRGINLPIEVDGKPEGVIGITGTYEEVIRYGQIVKKMAEILIRERIRMDEERLDLRIRSRFLEDWVLSDGLSNERALSERGLALGIDIGLPRRCMLVSVRELHVYTRDLEGQQFIEHVENAVNGHMAQYRGTIILRNAGRQILLVNRRSTEDMIALANRLTEELYSQFHTQIIVGIDGDAPDIHAAYLQANRAWRAAIHSKNDRISYDTLDTELILDQISQKAKSQYLQKIFGQCSAAELREHATLLEAYFEAEGSLKGAAEALFIHKNTLQYRLRQLAQITGLDVRKPSNAPALYMAVQCFRDLETEEQLFI